jgi:4-alpha-glucanotransferase
MRQLNPAKNLAATLSKDKSQRLKLQKRAGILVPLFSIYSRKSLGIADLEDLKLLIDWTNLSNNSIIQLLPLNEVNALFCPYDSISSFALEPVYLSLEKLPTVKNNSLKPKIDKIKKEFPVGRSHMDYRIKRVKLALLWEIFSGQSSTEPADFKKFRAENSYWLPDFALFRVLKEHFGGKAWYEWEEKYKKYDSSILENFQKEHEKEIIFQMWLQWQLYQQLKEVREYANSKKILLKGDLPILVSRDSADVWAHPEFFKLEFVAGAPPDMYCAKGQRWGMPTYNWEKIAADGYRYVKEKLKYAQEFYDILRIDHVVGLFRIWSIPYEEPLENQGLNGFFDPMDKTKWREHGRNLLNVILKNTKMFLCAEDLGVIPKECPKTLKELGIPGNDVQRWTKDWKTKHDFLKSQGYRSLSVAMLSTHDTTNWMSWWEYEAGTVDEGLFMRKCSDHRNIGFERVKDKLFDAARSKNNRLRWLDSIDSVAKLVDILGKKKEELADFIDIYKNSYQEKEKLWKQLKLKGTMREQADAEILHAALKITLDSQAIFCIQLITDWLYLTDIFKGDSYQYRINTPGTISDKNWSLTMPISLEELLKHEVTKEIRQMVVASGRT